MTYPATQAQTCILSSATRTKNKNLLETEIHIDNTFFLFFCFFSQVLNGLEVMGYKVVCCGDYMTGEQRHDQKEFVWTMYKNKEEWERSTK